jgi:cephalosporin-C deacetylase
MTASYQQQVLEKHQPILKVKLFKHTQTISRGPVFAALLLVLPLLHTVALDKNPSAYTLSVSADRADAIYHRGETVTYTISVSLKGKPVDDAKVKWTISKDGKDIRQNGVAKLENGKAVVTGKLDEPGFLQCRADITPPGEKGKTVRAGAAIDALEIKPSLPAPDDFDAFWSAERKKLAAVPLNVRLTPVKSPVAGVECFDLQGDGLGGPLSGYLARPVGAKTNRLPAIVLTHGAGVASSRLSVAAQWAADGFIAIDFNAHGLPNGKPQDFYKNLSRGELKEYYKKGCETRDEFFFHTLFLRLQRAMDVATAQPEWNGKTLIVCGRSQGGGQAIVAGGLDPRVTFIAAQIPALCDHTGIVAGRINGWPHLIPNDAKKPDEKILQTARYYDAVNFAARTHAQAFFTVGFIDITCPPTGVYAAYNQLPAKKNILNQVHTGHASSREADEAVRRAALAHLKQVKP